MCDSAEGFRNPRYRACSVVGSGLKVQICVCLCLFVFVVGCGMCMDGYGLCFRISESSYPFSMSESFRLRLLRWSLEQGSQSFPMTYPKGSSNSTHTY